MPCSFKDLFTLRDEPSLIHIVNIHWLMFPPKTLCPLLVHLAYGFDFG